MSQASDTMTTPATESKADATAMQAAMAQAKPAKGKQAPKAVARTGAAQRNAGRETITLESAVRFEKSFDRPWGRDEARDGPSGFESRVEQAQEFAAMLAMQALAAISAAEGACSAYEHITGEIWKPYVPATPASAAIGRQAATARMSAFD